MNKLTTADQSEDVPFCRSVFLFNVRDQSSQTGAELKSTFSEDILRISSEFGIRILSWVADSPKKLSSRAYDVASIGSIPSE